MELVDVRGWLARSMPVEKVGRLMRGGFVCNGVMYGGAKRVDSESVVEGDNDELNVDACDCDCEVDTLTVSVVTVEDDT